MITNLMNAAGMTIFTLGMFPVGTVLVWLNDKVQGKLFPSMWGPLDVEFDKDEIA